MLKLMCDACGCEVETSAIDLANFDGTCPCCGDKFFPSDVGDVEHEPT